MGPPRHAPQALAAQLPAGVGGAGAPVDAGAAGLLAMEEDLDVGPGGGLELGQGCLTLRGRQQQAQGVLRNPNHIHIFVYQQ